MASESIALITGNILSELLAIIQKQSKKMNQQPGLDYSFESTFIQSNQNVVDGTNCRSQMTQLRANSHEPWHSQPFGIN